MARKETLQANGVTYRNLSTALDYLNIYPTYFSGDIKKLSQNSGKPVNNIVESIDPSSFLNHLTGTSGCNLSEYLRVFNEGYPQDAPFSTYSDLWRYCMRRNLNDFLCLYYFRPYAVHLVYLLHKHDLADLTLRRGAKDSLSLRGMEFFEQADFFNHHEMSSYCFYYALLKTDNFDLAKSLAKGVSTEFKDHNITTAMRLMETGSHQWRIITNLLPKWGSRKNLKGVCKDIRIYSALSLTLEEIVMMQEFMLTYSWLDLKLEYGKSEYNRLDISRGLFRNYGTTIFEVLADYLWGYTGDKSFGNVISRDDFVDYLLTHYPLFGE